MDKPFWESLTFWGAVILSLSLAFEELGVLWPTLLVWGKAIGALAGIFGIRKAIG